MGIDKIRRKLVAMGDGDIKGDFSVAGDVTIGGDLGVVGVMSVAAFAADSFTMDTNGFISVAAAGTSYFDMSLGTGFFKTSSGTNRLMGAIEIATNKGMSSDGGGAVFDFSSSTGGFYTSQGTNRVAGDIELATNIGMTADAGTGAFDLSLATGIFKTPTGLTTIGGDMVLTGHANGQTMHHATFQFPNPGTDWTPTIDGAALTTNLAAKKIWIPLTGLKVGDEIVAYQIDGKINANNNASTFDCKLVVTDNEGNNVEPTNGAIAQRATTTSDAFQARATMTTIQTVAAGQLYALEIVASSDSTNGFVKTIGACVDINRK